MDLAPVALLLFFFIACALWWRERGRARQLQRELDALRKALEQDAERLSSLSRRENKPQDGLSP